MEQSERTDTHQRQRPPPVETFAQQKPDKNLAAAAGLYRLAPNAFVCVVAEGAIFLDVNANAYLGINAQQVSALASVVEGWPAADRHQVGLADSLGFAESLCARGVLVRPGLAGRSAVAPAAVQVRDQLVYWDEMSPNGTRLRHRLQFARSIGRAYLQLSAMPLQKVIQRTQALRDQCGPDAPFDNAAARELVSIYYHLRAWTFMRRGRCLLDSLAMLEFLRLHNLYPKLVFGVRFRPFAAHTWLQHDDLVLNGSAGFVRAYRPILVL